MLVPGYIYLMRLWESTDPWECAHKIGRSQHPDDRVRQVGIVLPYELTLVHVFWVRDPVYVERAMHKHLRRFHLQGEWFWPHPQWVNWFRSLSQHYLDTGNYPTHEPYPNAAGAIHG